VIDKGIAPEVEVIQKITTPIRPMIGVIEGNRVTLPLEKEKLNLILYINTISKPKYYFITRH
jgi:hypothetical protein